MTPTTGTQPAALCVSCKAEKRATPATLLLDDAPYCLPCAKELNFSSAEIAIGARAFLGGSRVPPQVRIEAKQEEMRQRQQAKSKRGPKPRQADSQTASEALAQIPQETHIPGVQAEAPAEEPEVQDTEHETNAAKFETNHPFYGIPEFVGRPEQPPEPARIEPRATLCFTSEQLDRMFSGLALAEKTRLIQEWLDREVAE